MDTSHGHDESPKMNITKKKTWRAKIPDVTKKKIKNHWKRIASWTGTKYKHNNTKTTTASKWPRKIMDTVCKHLSDITQTWCKHHWDNIQTSFKYHSNIIQTSFRHYVDNTKTTARSRTIKNKKRKSSKQGSKMSSTSFKQQLNIIQTSFIYHHEMASKIQSEIKQ